MAQLIDFWQGFRRNRAAVLGLGVVIGIILAALLAPILAPGDPFAMVGRPLTPPFTAEQHPLGADALGRDMLSMLLHGARVSLAVGLVSTAASMTVGVAVGALAGYFGGLVDDLLMRITEIVQTMPNFLFALAIVSILGPRVGNVILAIAVVAWPHLARMVRAEFLSFREREFVQACRSMGMSDFRIIVSEILPNALPSAVVLGSVTVAFSILVESALAFLGLGDPNVISWGWMVGQGREAMRTEFWMIAIPGFAIVVTVLGVSLVGEGLNDALNPHRRAQP